MKLRLVGIGLLVGIVAVLIVPGIKRSDRIAVATLLVAASAGLFAFSQARSAVRQADAAEAAKRREERHAAESAAPAFEWFIPTGSADVIEIHVKNAGGLITVNYAGVTSGGEEVSLDIPTRKVSPGEMMRFRFTPRVPDRIYPMQFCLRFQDVRENGGQIRAVCSRLGAPFITDPA